jgi:cytidylate kinase
VYACWADRVHRIKLRKTDCADVAQLIHSVDEERLRYVCLNYGENQADLYLYDLMVNSRSRADIAAGLILSAMKMAQ